MIFVILSTAASQDTARYLFLLFYSMLIRNFTLKKSFCFIITNYRFLDIHDFLISSNPSPGGSHWALTTYYTHSPQNQISSNKPKMAPLFFQSTNENVYVNLDCFLSPYTQYILSIHCRPSNPSLSFSLTSVESRLSSHPI